MTGDGRIDGVATGGHRRATVVLSTSHGTVGHLATAPNPVRAPDSAFGRLGDVSGPGVAPTGDGYEYVGPTSVVVRPLEAGGDGDRSTVALLDLRSDRPVVRSLPVGDLDGDGWPDVVVPGHADRWDLHAVRGNGPGDTTRSSRSIRPVRT